MMPDVLEAPEVLETPSTSEDTTIVLHGFAGMLASLRAGLAARRRASRQRRLERVSSQQFELPIDILARKYPDMFIRMG